MKKCPECGQRFTSDWITACPRCLKKLEPIETITVECKEICDSCRNCPHAGYCHWDTERRAMVREEEVDA